MIHFTCDSCGRAIDPSEETRYVVRVEVYASIGDQTDPDADDADHLEEIEDLLERLDDVDEQDHEVYTQARYDLCPACRERFVRNPLGRRVTRLGYSEN